MLRRSSIMLAAATSACLVSSAAFGQTEIFSSWENSLLADYQNPASGNLAEWQPESGGNAPVDVGFSTTIGVTHGQYALRVNYSPGYRISMKTFDWSLWNTLTNNGTNNQGGSFAVDVTIPSNSFAGTVAYSEMGLASVGDDNDSGDGGQDEPFTNRFRVVTYDGVTRTLTYDINPLAADPNPPGGNGYYGVWLTNNNNSDLTLGTGNGAVYFDNMRFISRHTGPASGTSNWTDAGSWALGRVPNSATAAPFFSRSADFGGTRTIVLDTAGITVNQIDADDGGAVQIDGGPTGNQLTFAGGGQIGIRVQQAFFGIGTTVNWNKTAPAEIRTLASNFDGSLSTVLLGGGITGSGTIVKTGPGLLVTQNVRTAGLDIRQGTVEITGPGDPNRTSKVSSLVVGTGGKFEIRDAAVIVDYSGTSPLTDLVAAAVAGRIASQDAGTSGSKVVAVVENSEYAVPFTTFGDQSVDADSVLITMTFKGDTNLDRSVTFTDLVSLAQAYGTTTGASWADGDSDYNGAVGFADLVALAQNYGSPFTVAESNVLADQFGQNFASDWARALGSVPEPTTLAALGGVALVALRRRSR